MRVTPSSGQLKVGVAVWFDRTVDIHGLANVISARWDLNSNIGYDQGTRGNGQSRDKGYDRFYAIGTSRKPVIASVTVKLFSTNGLDMLLDRQRLSAFRFNWFGSTARILVRTHSSMAWGSSNSPGCWADRCPN